MSKFVTTPAASQLLLEGTIALAEIESCGCRIDKGYLEKTMADTAQRIREVKAEIRACPEFEKWRRRFGDKSNEVSPDQLAAVVFTELGYKSPFKTKGGTRASASEKALEGIDIPIVKKYFLARKLERLYGTYLGGIRRELVQHGEDWYVHPNYNLNTVETFRSSANDPNYTNIYKRDPEYAEIVRRAYIPRRGNQFIELDYAAAEVKICACYTLDPVAMAECEDKTKDAHRDAATRLFFLKPEEVTKSVRNVAKGPFVFAQFYGDYYLNCAKNIWPMIQNEKVKDSFETIVDRLAANGVTELGDCDPDQRPRSGTFEAHVKGVEDWYWNTKYKVHTQWKHDWWDSYRKYGGFQMKTGFAVNGIFSRNEVINSPVQGASFHCLLKSIIRQLRLLRRHRMKTNIIGEIHDCSVADGPPSERDDYIEMSREVMTTWLRKQWPWIVVNLEVEPECCPVDANWYEKMSLAEREGKWVPADADKWRSKYGDWSLQG